MRPPPPPVLVGLGVDRVDRYLGGRANSHWLAVRDGADVVVRCYSSEHTPSAIDFEMRVLEHVAGKGWAVPLPICEIVVVDGRVWERSPACPGRRVRPERPAASATSSGSAGACSHAFTLISASSTSTSVTGG